MKVEKKSIDCVFCRVFSEHEKMLSNVNHKLFFRGFDQSVSKLILIEQNFFVIEDIKPTKKTHFLIVSKRHYRNFSFLKNYELDSMKNFFVVLHILKQCLGGDKSFQLAMNSGKKAGQTIMHLHAHFLSDESFLYDKLVF